MAEGSNTAPIDIEEEEEYVTLTRTHPVPMKKPDAFKFLCNRYAIIFNKIANDTVPGTQLRKRLTDIAIIVRSGQATVTRLYVLDRNESIWSKFLLKAVSELSKQCDKLAKMHDMLDWEKQQTKFENDFLKPAITSRDRAQKLAKACKDVISDMEEHLGES